MSERKNRMLVERARSMLFDAKLLKVYWAEAVATAAYTINRSPSRVLSDMTPEEKWSGNKPSTDKKIEVRYANTGESHAAVQALLLCQQDGFMFKGGC